MTAEAIVMNRSAVALAADSAVTVSGPGAFKTFDTANKLFELIKGSNIGVMVYNNMSLNGTPWETIIKAYRKDNQGFSSSQVSDYLEHFLRYLASSTSLLAEEDDVHGVSSIAFDCLIPVAKSLEARYAEFVTAKGKIIKTKAYAVLNSICNEWELAIDSAEDIAGADLIEQSTLKRKYGEEIKDLTLYIFGKFELTSTLINRLVKLCLLSVTKQMQNASDSGLVFAGFGTEEYFPSYVSTRVSARVLKQVIRLPESFVQVDVSAPGHIQTFAQDEPALGWITGISGKTRRHIAEHWNYWIKRELPRELRKAMPGGTVLPAAQRNQFVKHVLDLASGQLLNFFEYMDRYEEEQFIKPLFESVAALPKDELGLLAESLVNITSLKQRMSVHQSNTVGGAIDVALISIGDGFVWLNRKHYFEERLNPTWHLTHGAKMSTIGEY